MDMVNKLAGALGNQGHSGQQGQQGQQMGGQQMGGQQMGGQQMGDQQMPGQQQTSGGGGGFLGGLGNKLNEAGGGGQRGEANEDMLDKGIDMFQQHVMGAGPQNNESVQEQFVDKQIAGAIRSQYKNTTGKDFPIKEKQQQFGM